MERNYGEVRIDEAIQEVLIEEKGVKKSKNFLTESTDENIVVPFVTGFSKESGQLKNIICKNWHILQNDLTVGNRLSKNPIIIFRKATNLKDHITSSYIKEYDMIKNKWSGFQNCGQCKACSDIGNNISRKIIRELQTKDGITYRLKGYTTCDTENIIYLIQCPCGLNYVGRTCRKLKTRIREHWRNIKLGVYTHPLSAHYKKKHDQNPKGSKFWALEVVKKWWRGENLDKKLSRREGFWIYQLNSLIPGGLNADFELKCFLKED